MRGGPRQFLYSKLLCWVALDRAIRLAERAGLADGRPARWRRTRGEIRHAILTRGIDPELGAFTQALGERALDASALALPLLGFLPATDPRVRSTVQRIQERLTAHGLVYRYLAEDGLPGGEATFALCSFWLVDNLASAARVDGAGGARFAGIAGEAHAVGLGAGERGRGRGALLGNWPPRLHPSLADPLRARHRASRGWAIGEMNDQTPVAILFDVDGCLISTGGAGTRSWRRAFEALYGIPADIGEFTEAGMTDPEVGSLTFTRVIGREPTDREMARLLAAYLEGLEDEVQQSPGYRVMPGVGGAAPATGGCRHPARHRQRRA